MNRKKSHVTHSNWIESVMILVAAIAILAFLCGLITFYIVEHQLCKTMSYTIHESDIPTSELLPHLCGISPERKAREEACAFEKDRIEVLISQGISPWRAKKQARQEASDRYQRHRKTARDLAREAGLATDQPCRIGTSIEAFRRSVLPLLEARIQAWNEEDQAQDQRDQDCYYESRATRFKFNRLIGHVRTGSHNDHGLGLYSWTKDGKTYRSWLGNEPLATPRQIAGKLLARYQGCEISILHTGWTTSNHGGSAVIGGIVVPTYQVFISGKLPAYVHTRERLLLDHGRDLDMEDAARAERELQGGMLDKESHAEFIARLCREAPSDPEPFVTGWQELSPDGMSFIDVEYDDTRDNDRQGEILGLLMDAVMGDQRLPDTKGRIWDDEDLAFGTLGSGSDQDNGRDVALLLGLSTQQIEDAFLAVGEDTTVRGFFEALPRKETSPEKLKARRETTPEQTLTF